MPCRTTAPRSRTPASWLRDPRLAWRIAPPSPRSCIRLLVQSGKRVRQPEAREATTGGRGGTRVGGGGLLFGCAGCAVVKPGAPRGGDARVERLSDQRVRE